LPATPTEVLGFLLASGIYTNKIAQKPKNKKKKEKKNRTNQRKIEAKVIAICLSLGKCGDCNGMEALKLGGDCDSGLGPRLICQKSLHRIFL